MGLLSVWVPVLSTIVGSAVTLAGTWLSNVRAVKLAVIERDHRRDERTDQRLEEARRLREQSYAEFLVAARALRDGAAPHGGSESLFAALLNAAAHIELRAPRIADGAVMTMIGAAERLVLVRRTNASGSPVALEAKTEFDRAYAALCSAMRADLANDVERG
jgi:hypothetical protein